MKSLIHRLPLEILDAVIDILASQDSLKDLISCSLTCQAFLPRCRRHIFNDITIDIEEDPASPNKLKELIEMSPWIAHRARQLHCMSLTVEILNGSSSPLAFDSFMNIHTLAIHCSPTKPSEAYLKWARLKPSVQTSLLRLIHLPSLVRLELEGIIGFLSSNLAQCTNLKTLMLYETELEECIGDSLSCIYATTTIKLNKLYATTISAKSIAKLLPCKGLPNQKLVFDMAELNKVRFEYDIAIEHCHFQILERATRLETLQLRFTASTDKISALTIAPLVASSLHSLKFLNLEIEIDDIDPLPIIFGELLSIAAHERNVIEDLCFALLIKWDPFFHPHIDWDLFDTHLLPASSTPAQTAQMWPSLRQVKLRVYLDTEDPVEKGMQESIYKFRDAMMNIRDTYLMRLCSSKLFDFDFSFSHIDLDYYDMINW